MTSPAHGPLFTLIVWPLFILLFKLDCEGPVLLARERVAGQGQHLPMRPIRIYGGQGAR